LSIGLRAIDLKLLRETYDIVKEKGFYNNISEKAKEIIYKTDFKLLAELGIKAA